MEFEEMKKDFEAIGINPMHFRLNADFVLKCYLNQAAVFN